MEKFNLITDYVQDHVDRYLIWIVAAPNEAKAVNGLLHQLESEGADVKQITAVYGVSSIEELDEIVKGGLKPGMVYSTHVMERV